MERNTKEKQQKRELQRSGMHCILSTVNSEALT